MLLARYDARMNRLLTHLFAATLVLTQSASAATVTDAQRKSFFDFYLKTFPDDHSDQPSFEARDGDPVLHALVDSVPKRGLRSLCRMERRVFAYEGAWSMDQRKRQYVWLDAKSCRKPARPIELQYPMPDADVVGLLEHEREVLKSARLLFGGSSQCARQRALNFSLARIEVGTSGSSTEVLAGLAFQSDRATSATVWVRRSGLDYNAWNVNCQ